MLEWYYLLDGAGHGGSVTADMELHLRGCITADMGVRDCIT